MAQERPIIVLIQGGVVSIESYAPLHQALSELGNLVTHPLHPTMYTHDLGERSTKSLVDDATNARSAIARLVEGAGQKVFVVCHSYGGLVSSEAVTENLTFKWRRANGLPGGVVHIYFIAAAVIEKGETVASIGGLPPELGLVQSEDKQLWTLNNAAVMYSDSPAAEADVWASLQRWQAIGAMTSPLTNEGWRYVDSTFLICTNDRTWSLETQLRLATFIGAKIDRIDTGHLPWLIEAKETAKRIDDAVQHTMMQTVL